jgi:anti-anti-sigma regulatory factor
MLRITVLNDTETTRLKLEGKLAHEWVHEARLAWASLGAMQGNKELIVDLLGVSFVDEFGERLLAEMHGANAKLVGSGPSISALIAAIQNRQVKDGNSHNKRKRSTSSDTQFKSRQMH